MAEFLPVTMTLTTSGVASVTITYTDAVLFSLSNVAPQSENGTVLPGGEFVKPFSVSNCHLVGKKAQATLSFNQNAIAVWQPIFAAATPIRLTMDAEGQVKFLHVQLVAALAAAVVAPLQATL